MPIFATLLLLCTALFAQQKGTLTDMRDGKIYKTTKIGKQIWMAENLNYEIKGSKCYDNEPVNCQIYGRLYDWNMAIKACPKGWRLPSSKEWNVLTEAVDGYETSGKFLKATRSWNKNGNGEDRFGFSALAGGYGYPGGSNFDDVGNFGKWWSSKEARNNYSDIRYMKYDNEKLEYISENKRYLYSVRCLQDHATPHPKEPNSK